MTKKVQVSKYHGLGNDYIVVCQSELSKVNISAADLAKKICRPHFGLGSDGLLVDCSDRDNFHLRIINPDGSEAEKSGNGLRIYAAWLFDQKRVGNTTFAVTTKGGEVGCQVHNHDKIIVQMGRAVFADSSQNAMSGKLQIADREFTFYYANVGNPHCVIRTETPFSEQQVRDYGPLIENHQRFANRTNVQFVSIKNNHSLVAQIWERGAGYTMASGSSSCAVAAVAYSLGWCESPVEIHMPGGKLIIDAQRQQDDFIYLAMTGPVERVFDGGFYLRIQSELP